MSKGPKHAIRNAFNRLGLQARPGKVVAALARFGVKVSEGQVRAVLMEMLKDAAKVDQRRLEARMPKVPPPVRRPAKVLARRGRRG
jgi:hypothetical protein